MSPCNQEEADTRMCVHFKDCLEKGARKVYIRTIDTDVIVEFSLNSRACILTSIIIWVAFGMGKHFQYFHMNSICQCLGEEKSRGLLFFHAYTGSDTTSQFLGKGKKSCWDWWKSYSTVTEAFLSATANPFQKLTESSIIFETLERFTCILYDKGTTISKVNDIHQDLFSKRAKHPTNSGKCIIVIVIIIVITSFFSLL